MNLNEKRELLAEIALLAPELTKKPEEQLNLLDLLAAFDKVLGKHRIDPESNEATELYKTLLNLGRLKYKPWKQRIEENVSSKDDSFNISFQKVKEERVPLTNITNKSFAENEQQEITSSEIIGRVQLPRIDLTSSPKQDNYVIYV